MRKTTKPVVEWLAANGADPETIAGLDGDIVVETNGLRWPESGLSAGPSVILYHSVAWPDDAIGMHAGRLLLRPVRLPMTVPPPDGLLESYRHAQEEWRRERDVREQILALAQRVKVLTVRPEDQLVISLPAEVSDATLDTVVKDVTDRFGDRVMLFRGADLAVVQPEAAVVASRLSAVPPVRDAEVVDLMAALKASFRRARSAREGGG